MIELLTFRTTGLVFHAILLSNISSACCFVHYSRLRHLGVFKLLIRPSITFPDCVVLSQLVMTIEWLKRRCFVFVFAFSYRSFLFVSVPPKTYYLVQLIEKLEPRKMTFGALDDNLINLIRSPQLRMKYWYFLNEELAKCSNSYLCIIFRFVKSTFIFEEN